MGLAHDSSPMGGTIFHLCEPEYMDPLLLGTSSGDTQ